MILVKVKKKIIEYTNNDIQSQDRLTFQNSSNNLIFNDSTNNIISAYSFLRYMTSEAPGWDSNPYPSNVGSTINY